MKIKINNKQKKIANKAYNRVKWMGGITVGLCAVNYVATSMHNNVSNYV